MKLKLNYLRLFKMLSKYTLYGILLQVCFYSFLLAEDSNAQKKSVREVYVDVNGTYGSVKEIFKSIENQTDFQFAYSRKFIPKSKKIKLTSGKRAVKEVLLEISKECRLRFKQVNNSISVNKLSDNYDAESDFVEIIQTHKVTGKVLSSEGNEALPGVSVLIKGTTNGTVTDINGDYSIFVPDNSILVFSYIGFESQEIEVGNQSEINLTLQEDMEQLEEIVVVGYGTQKKESLTGAVGNVQGDELDRVHVATTSGMLAGKMAGVSFRQPDGRPGAGAWLQIRNMGTPLYIIDGIQKDEGQFNNLAPQDIESITILKDASAAIYGVRAANGVVVVTTKKGKLGQKNTVSVDAYYGVQNWSRFPKGVGAYDWMLGKAEAEMNQHGTTAITPEELEKWKNGTEPGYQSFDWYDYIVGKNAPQSSINISTSGGSDKTNYYLSISRFDQDAVFKDFTFNRTNIQSNIDTRIAEKLKVGAQISARLETRDNPGVPGYDDYWQPRFALFRNRPTERPYANDNPEYPNHISNIETNWALLNKDITGWWREDWKTIQTNFTAEYEILEGFTAKGMYSYYYADQVANTFEYTYDVFTYDQNTDNYNRTGGNDNPYRDRTQRKITENVAQFHLNYNKTIAGKHSIGVVAVAESIQRRDQRNWLHSVPQTNYLDILQFADMDAYDDSDYEEARIGYIGRINYNFDSKYYLEVAGRYDGSWKFSPDKRWGFFPSISGGWRITQENFFDINFINELKLRGSYGQLGDDNVGIGPFDYIPGYTYGVGKGIIDGNTTVASRDRGKPVDNISWFTSTIIDFGVDFAMLDSKVSGTLDYFDRTRTGLRGFKYDVVLPAELGYTLPEENLNSDSQFGYEATLAYSSNKKGVNFKVGGNFSYARSKFNSSYKPRWGNSWDHYRNSREDRYENTFWGYQVVGQFQSQEEINNYKINIDGQGNKTLLPGDFIYKDINGDGKIDGYDERPIGYGTWKNPIVNIGLNLSLDFKGIDFSMDFSGGSMYSYNQQWEMRWPFQNTGNLLSTMYEDRWHRADLYDLNSEWIPGKNPSLSFNNPNHSNYNKQSDWWMVNINYLRLRTMEIGYSLPDSWIQKIKMERARIYLNTYNLFSIDNVKPFGIDPEVADENGLQYPQNKLFNVGVNLTF
ncbi:SusC/RagA family TonB-linked outer membrane protein [Flexithrix dorotheae]|uniref:SusC/RagA family TonB-linked outer membrane protein n=1 Tax=Flexithrix dorotheae TaxID=70993 RepID=UPI0003A613F0|nr:TonB-dependent receptor [Flexithrix dorotheae]